MSEATKIWRPTPQQIAAARGKVLTDVIGPA